MKFCEGFTFVELQESLVKGEAGLDVHCVSLGLMSNGVYDSFSGIAIAKALLVEGRERRIAIFSILSTTFLREKLSGDAGRDLKFLFSHREVVFFDVVGLLPDSEGRFPEFREAVERGGDPGPIDASAVVSSEMAKLLGELNHLVHGAPDPRDLGNRRVRMAVERAREHFPSLTNRTDDEVLDFVASTEVEIPLVMEGAELPGVFCDIDGTVLVGGKPAADVLAMLVKHESEGVSVTLWTLGNVSETARVLSENGIAYPLRNKLDFAGATVETVIDDEDRNSFFLKTRVHAKRFIRV
jgi:hypothetical protein